jgi:membrane-associated HD superfamily phosphohydrolase
MSDNLNLNTLLRVIFAYVIFISGGIILYNSYFLPIWYYLEPVEINHMLSNSPSFFEYISKIESDKIIHKLSFFFVIFYPFVVGAILIVSYSAVVYNEVFRFFYFNNSKEKKSNKYLLLNLFLLSIPFSVGIFALYFLLMLLNINQAFDFHDKFFSINTIFLGLLIYALGFFSTLVLRRIKDKKKYIKVIPSLCSFFINLVLQLSFLWSLFLIVAIIIAYLMGHSKAPIYNNIPLVALALLIWSYFYYKKKEYKKLKKLKIIFEIIFNSIYLIFYALLFIIMLDRYPEFFNKYPIAFGEGFYGSILGLGLFLVSSTLLFFILKHDLKKIKN